MRLLDTHNAHRKLKKLYITNINYFLLVIKGIFYW
jgi:hypothetical protein